MSTAEWIAAVGLGLTTPFLLVALIGCLIPRRHTVSRSISLKQSVATVWDSITGFDRIPGWWPVCIMVEHLPDKDGHSVYRETFLQGRRRVPIEIELLEWVKPKRLTTAIVDVKGPFRGRWVYDLEAGQSGGAQLTLTEFGEVKNPFIRAIFRLTMNKAMFVESYLICLGAKFGEEVTVERPKPNE